MKLSKIALEFIKFIGFILLFICVVILTGLWGWGVTMLFMTLTILVIYQLLILSYLGV